MINKHFNLRNKKNNSFYKVNKIKKPINNRN